MSLTAGTKLGPYEIVRALGAGGMGEVYQADDSRLGRSVAIKVLPAHLSQNADLKDRFEREARAISNLSHPNICALFDVGHDNGVDYLVMEHLEGETLADRLEAGPLAPDEVLRYGGEIAAALDKAHRSGVVHRDLKPGNVMITKTGVKLLDFGLAKMAAPEAAAVESAITEMASEQFSDKPLTARGTILGTFQYMAPEQLEAGEIDARTDIFALGAVIHEMATGKKAFEGKSQASLIAAILEREPSPISSIAPMSPPALDRLVQACLAKDPDDRVQTAHDVKLQLDWIREGGSQAGIPAPLAAYRRRNARLSWVLVAVLAAISVSLAVLMLTRQQSSPLRVTAYVPPPPENQFGTWAGGHSAISPDGSMIVFLAYDAESSGRLWVRTTDGADTRALPGTEGGFFPFWSADSRHIAFFAKGKLRRIDASGGSPLVLCDAPSGRGGAWSANGTILFAPDRQGPLYALPATGGTPRAVTAIDSTLNSHRFPCFLPDGEHFLFGADTGGGGQGFLCVGSLSEGLLKQLFAARSNARFVNGHLLYVRENTLVALPFDTGRLEPSGDAIIVTDPVSRNGNYMKAQFSASNNGILAYIGQALDMRGQVTVYQRDGKLARAIEAPTFIDDIAISPDGTKLAIARPSEGGDWDIWTYDLQREIFTRLTFAGTCDDPAWSPDGKLIAYSLSSEHIAVKRAGGAGDARTLFSVNGTDLLPIQWSRDGRFLFYLDNNTETAEDIWALELSGDSTRTALLNSPFREMHPQVSPDGNWLAYCSNESGEYQVYVIRFPGLDEKIQVSRRSAGSPFWRTDGRELVYIGRDGTLRAVDIDNGPEGLRIGEVHDLARARIPNLNARTSQYAISPDASIIYALEPLSTVDRERTMMTLDVNWTNVLDTE